MIDIDEEIKQALLKKAVGYETEEREVILDKTGKEIKKIKVTKKHIPPDVKALKTIMKLKHMGKW